MMKMNTGYRFFVILLLALALTACGSDSDDETPSPDTTVDPGPEAGPGKPDRSGDPADSGADLCQPYCEAVIAAGCASGPATIDPCITNCNSMQTGTCSSAWLDVLECAGSSPQVTCVSGKPTVGGCEAEATALSECRLSLPDAGS